MSATSRATRPARVKKISEWEMIERLPAVQEAMKILPSNYDFEIPKTLWKILSVQAKTVVLQFPEGLLIFSCMISDILHRFTGAEVVILSEVTYGACCVDDFAAMHIQADLLVHYGHSCLVPVQDTKVKTLYVFVGIRFSVDHLVETVKSNFEQGSRLALLGTVQFLRSVWVYVLMV
ncbi:hypothetical protein EON63_03240 [archaeon]|nr:MAG: hypothetical protein EON63_03240 [archaeon]